jgi:hypothetical protein
MSNAIAKKITAITEQTNHKRFFERVALQPFQKISWFGFERKALYGYSHLYQNPNSVKWREAALHTNNSDN